jgi:Zn-dependent protease
MKGGLCVFGFSTVTSPDFLFIFIAVVIGLVLHEFAHAAVAVALGDDTPRRQGRFTLNPLSHISVIGLILVFVAPLGYARAVQVMPSNFKRPRLAMALIAVAGPITNLIIAVVALLGIRYLTLSDSSFMMRLLNQMALVNCNLFVFNLIPIPPLDGSRIAAAFLRGRAWTFYSNFDRMGQYIVVLLVLFGSTTILYPLFDHTMSWLAGCFQLEYTTI